MYLWCLWGVLFFVFGCAAENITQHVFPNNPCIVVAGGTILTRGPSSCDCGELSLPDTLFTDYPNLRAIDISSCNLTGPIPQNIGSLNGLFGLVLNNNQFNGILLDNLNLNPLKQLRIENNQFKGTIPSTFASAQFNELNLANNMFSGTIPRFTNLKNNPLAIFDLSNNNFAGSAFEVLTMPNFTGYFSISGNQLTSPVPPNIPPYISNSSLSKISCIMFHHNGTIPTWCSSPVCRCAPQCKNSIWEIGEMCDDLCCQNCTSGVLQPSTFPCRLSAGICDVTELCTGKNASCPHDVFENSSFPCSLKVGVCDTAQFCTGNSSVCPPKSYANQSVVCFSEHNCDIYCNGTSSECPSDDCNAHICGDLYCDPTRGEDCVNCPSDCSLSLCNLCGDGRCSANESCANCAQDCACAPLTCVPACVNGTCNDGVCECDDPYIGPACDTISTPVKVAPNDTSPGFNIGFESSQFSIDIVKISLTNTSDYLFWNYSSVLPNRALINIYFYIFTTTTNFTFAGTSHTMVQNTIKVAFFVAHWNFMSARNEFVVWMAGSSNLPITECDVAQRVDENDNLKWLALTVNGQTLYTNILDYAIVDGTKRTVKFGSSQNTQIEIRAPFFWYNLTLDPNFALLVHTPSSLPQSSCKKPKKIAWEYFLAIPIGVVLILVGLGIFFSPKIKLWWKKKFGNQKVHIELD